MRRDDPLLQPLTIRGVTFKNRVMSTAHAPSYAEAGLPGERYQLYHEEKARGGLALTMFGGSSTVSRDSPSAFGQIDVSSDRCIEPFRSFARRIHAHGCAIMCQISHMGRRTRSDTGDWLPIVAPSAIREPQHRGFPKEAAAHDIARIVQDYAAAARRCRDAGLDGVEVLATSHLVGQFLSPAMNQRSDAYGGDTARRMRFGLAILEAVRVAVADDTFLVGLRMSGDEMLDGGLDAADCLDVAHRFADSGLVDYLNVVGGNAISDTGIAKQIPNMGVRTAPYLRLAAAIKAATSVPVFHATRITDLETARHAIADNLLDMVALTRAHIADPHIVAKLMRDEADRIRPCVGANHCIDRLYTGGEMLCLHNPATGRERHVPQLIKASEGLRQHVVIVGGGPAGLEAARVSALRGHRVTLLEAAKRLGGQVNIAALAPRREEIAEVVGWLAREVEHAGAAVHLNTYAEALDVAALHPEVVIIATGGVPNLGTVEGAESLAVSTWDVLAGHIRPAGRVLLFDDHGGHQGLSCAAALAGRVDLNLTVVTPERSLGIELGATSRPPYMRRLHRAGARIRPDRRLVGVERSGNCLRAILRDVYTDEVTVHDMDAVIVEAGTVPSNGLYIELAPHSLNGGQINLDALANGRSQPFVAGEGFRLWSIGDAVAHRGIHAAILEARRLCQDL